MSGGLSVGRQDFLRELVSGPPHLAHYVVVQRSHKGERGLLRQPWIGRRWTKDRQTGPYPVKARKGPSVIKQMGIVMSGRKRIEVNV